MPFLLLVGVHYVPPHGQFARFATSTFCVTSHFQLRFYIGFLFLVFPWKLFLLNTAMLSICWISNLWCSILIYVLTVPSFPDVLPFLFFQYNVGLLRLCFKLFVGCFRLSTVSFFTFPFSGYYGDGFNAIVVFNACFLPDRSRHDYHYVMDNLFL